MISGLLLEEWDAAMRVAVSPLFIENQSFMETGNFSRLNPEKKKVIIDHVASLDESDEVIEKLKVMKRILNAAFGEACNQIVKLDQEGVADELQFRQGLDMEYINTRVNDVILKNYLISHSIGFRIIIHFPEITIINSEKRSHVIKDLYVMAQFGKDVKFGTRLWGVRGTMSKLEALSGYMHSHLQASYPDTVRFGQFCLGSGEITQVLSLLANNFDEANFTLFCIHLQNYVKWESIEGVPHMRMANIGSGGNGIGSLGSLRTKVADVIYPYVFANDNLGDWLRSKMEFSITSTNIEVEADDDFEIWIAKILNNQIEPARLSLGSRSNDYCICRKSSDGTYYSIDGTPRSPRLATRQPLLKFKGEDKFLKIENETYEIKSSRYPHPDITQELVRRLSKDFTKAAITCKGTEIQDYTPGSVEAVAGSDIFPM